MKLKIFKRKKRKNLFQQHEGNPTSKFIWNLLEENNELKKEIEKLKKRLEELKNEKSNKRL